MNAWQLPNPITDYDVERLELLLADEVLDRYDVLALQEVFSFGSQKSDRVLERASEVGYGHFVRTPCPPLYEIAQVDSGLMVVSRFPILESSFTPFNDAALESEDVLAWKGFLTVVIEPYQGCEFSLTVTHMQAKRGEQYDATRMAQRDLMVEVLTERESWLSGVDFVMGDFNVGGGTEEYALLEDTIESLGVDDVTRTFWLERNPSGVEPVNGSDPEFPRTATGTVTNAAKSDGKQLDYVFGGGDALAYNTTGSPIAAGTRLVAIESVIDPLDAPADEPFIRLSDHLGVTFLGVCLDS